MAPITATTTGVTPQVIDDPELVDLITRLSGFRSSGTGAADSTSNKKINLDSLISELSKYKSWRFQEQVRKLMSFCTCPCMSCRRFLPIFLGFKK